MARRSPPTPWPIPFAPALAGLAGLAGLAAVALSPRDAHAGGALLPGQELGTQPGDVDPGSFAHSDTCRACHFSGAPSADAYMPSDTWAGTMMANSMRDPVFHAAIAVANQDTPGVGTYCLRCHSPISYVRGNATADPSGATSFADPIDAQGVSCEACHRMANDPAGGDDAPYLIGGARIHYDDVQTKRGPYPSCDTFPDDPACSQSPGHATVQEPSLADSALCGQCHQVDIPGRKLKDTRGVDTAFDFPLDTTYAEWQQSVYGQPGPEARSCQDCHMAADVDGPVCNLFDAKDRTAPPQHAFVGGNHWGIRAVMEAAPDRVELYPNAFDAALGRTLDMLQASAAVTIVEAPTSSAPGESIDVTVRVENLAGHKFPTGYAESRRAWVTIGFEGATSGEVTVLGAFDLETGTIEEEASTRVYRAVHGRWNGAEAEGEEHLTLHDSIVLDTRIPPLGFVASPTTTPVGPIDFADGEGGYRNYDEATLTVTVPADFADPTATLRASVVFQSMTRQYVEFLAAENRTNDAGQRLLEIFEATGEGAPILVASATSEIALAAPSGAGGAGGAGSGAGPSSTAATSGSSTGTGQGGGTVIDEESQGDVEDEGCGCRTAGAPARHGVGVALASLALGAALWRRRVRRAS